MNQIVPIGLGPQIRRAASTLPTRPLGRTDRHIGCVSDTGRISETPT